MNNEHYKANLKKFSIEATKRAIALLEPQGRWTQRRNAGDKHGFDTSPHSSSATCFCLNGAVAREAREVTTPAYTENPSLDMPQEESVHGYIWDVMSVTLAEQYSHWSRRDPVTFNDAEERQQSEVVDLLKKTLAKLEA